MGFQKAGLAGRFQTVPDGYTDRCNTATTATLPPLISIKIQQIFYETRLAL